MELRRLIAELDGARLERCGDAMAARFAAGGRLFAYGNGGSATDAQQLATLFLNPGRGTRALPAFALGNDTSVVTALCNDIGVGVVFARQLAAFGGTNDIAIGLSTSGSSENLLRAFDEASKRGMLTVGLAGYDGGKMAELDSIDYLFVAPSFSVHRIQEAQTIVIDAAASGGEPGSVVVTEVDGEYRHDRAAGTEPSATPLFDAHGMQPDVVFGVLDMLGARAGRIIVVGCEPASIDCRIGLSEPVEAAVDQAVTIIMDLIATTGPSPAPPPGSSPAPPPGLRPAPPAGLSPAPPAGFSPLPSPAAAPCGHSHFSCEQAPARRPGRPAHGQLP